MFVICKAGGNVNDHLETIILDFGTTILDFGSTKLLDFVQDQYMFLICGYETHHKHKYSENGA